MKESNSNTNENDTTTSTGLTHAHEIVGGSEVAVAGKTRAVHYIDRLENGKSFDSSVDRGQPFSIQLGVGQVIKR